MKRTVLKGCERCTVILNGIFKTNADILRVYYAVLRFFKPWINWVQVDPSRVHGSLKSVYSIPAGLLGLVDNFICLKNLFNFKGM